MHDGGNRPNPSTEAPTPHRRPPYGMPTPRLLPILTAISPIAAASLMPPA